MPTFWEKFPDHPVDLLRRNFWFTSIEDPSSFTQLELIGALLGEKEGADQILEDQEHDRAGGQEKGAFGQRVRLLGFDNAHAAGKRKLAVAFDHEHRETRTRFGLLVEAGPPALRLLTNMQQAIADFLAKAYDLLRREGVDVDARRLDLVVDDARGHALLGERLHGADEVLALADDPRRTQ